MKRQHSLFIDLAAKRKGAHRTHHKDTHKDGRAGMKVHSEHSLVNVCYGWRDKDISDHIALLRSRLRGYSQAQVPNKLKTSELLTHLSDTWTLHSGFSTKYSKKSVRRHHITKPNTHKAKVSHKLWGMVSKEKQCGERWRASKWQQWEAAIMVPESYSHTASVFYLTCSSLDPRGQNIQPWKQPEAMPINTRTN